jgi:hypothetical protein
MRAGSGPHLPDAHQRTGLVLVLLADSERDARLRTGAAVFHKGVADEPRR